MYPYYFKKQQEVLPPLISLHISIHYSTKLSPYALVNLLALILVSRSCHHLSSLITVTLACRILIYPIVTSPTLVYSITQSFLLPSYSRLLYIKVIDFSLYLLLSIQPLCIFILSSFGLHRLLVGLRRDPFIYLSLHYTCPWCIPGFVWCLYYQQRVP
jgi:hypothetical protein